MPFGYIPTIQDIRVFAIISLGVAFVILGILFWMRFKGRLDANNRFLIVIPWVIIVYLTFILYYLMTNWQAILFRV